MDPPIMPQNSSISEVQYHCSSPDGTDKQIHCPAQRKHESRYCILSPPLLCFYLTLSGNKNARNIHTDFSEDS